MNLSYRWQGEPVKVTFGHCIVKPKKDKPLFWLNYECSQNGGKTRIPAIKIIFEGRSFIIANHFGIGVYKLQHGGWPEFPHFGFPEDAKFRTNKRSYHIKEFDGIGYNDHEDKREQWQALWYPEEVEKIQGLINSFEKRYLRKMK